MDSARVWRLWQVGESCLGGGLKGANGYPLEVLTGPMARLKIRKDFIRLSKSGRKAGTKHLLLQAAPRPPDCVFERKPRVGLTASRRVGGAVKRNRARRRLSSLADQVINLYAQSDQDYVLVARPAILSASFSQLTIELEGVLDKLNLRRHVSDNH